MARLSAAANRPGLLALGAVCATLGCAKKLPERPVERALVRDLERIVTVRQGVGWNVDDVEVDAAMSDAMKSVCRVPDVDRSSSLQWLDREIVAQGGPVEEAWRQKGKDLDKVEELLLLTRTRLILRMSDGWARGGKCPFWMEPDPGFRGVHFQGGRYILTLEAGGRFTEEFALGTIRYGGGGSGRILGGYGFTDQLSLHLGIESGGGARFTNLQLGEQSEIPQLVALFAAPVVGRWTYGLGAHIETEVGPMAYIDKLQVDQKSGKTTGLHYDLGLRLGIGFGGSYLRLQRGPIPRFTFAITVDYIPPAGDRPSFTQVGFGARTGADFSKSH